MKILAIDSSALTASAALVTEDTILAEYNTNYKKTHSLTLLPMINEILKMTETDVNELNAVAVAKGPGSFTGLRIGSATAKGLTLAKDIPVIEISTLEAMAYQLHGTNDLICPMMDARRSQVYCGIYRFEGEDLICLSHDAAKSAEEIANELNALGEKVILLGDGIPVNEEMLKQTLKIPYSFARPFQNRQRAAALGILAFRYYREGRMVSSDAHVPVYLRVSQAERERAERERKKKE